MNLSNCPQCGAVYVMNNYQLCPNCLRAIEEEYRKCAEYLRANRTCNLYQLSEGTGVSVRQITRFIREGRIAPKDAPNVQTPCDVCGEPVAVGHICASCKKKLTADVHRMREVERRKSDKAYEGEGAYLSKDRFDKGNHNV